MSDSNDSSEIRAYFPQRFPDFLLVLMSFLLEYISSSPSDITALFLCIFESSIFSTSYSCSPLTILDGSGAACCHK